MQLFIADLFCDLLEDSFLREQRRQERQLCELYKHVAAIQSEASTCEVQTQTDVEVEEPQIDVHEECKSVARSMHANEVALRAELEQARKDLAVKEEERKEAVELQLSHENVLINQHEALQLVNQSLEELMDANKSLEEQLRERSCQRKTIEVLERKVEDFEDNKDKIFSPRQNRTMSTTRR
uniref:Uncharacterized protein n=1 Tax=Knipowitschia caucasica TaxID=637954 RepID=A0AAV2KHX9_KNICA